MEVSVSDAKAQLTDLARRAEAGEEIVLTRHSHPAPAWPRWSVKIDWPFPPPP